MEQQTTTVVHLYAFENLVRQRGDSRSGARIVELCGGEVGERFGLQRSIEEFHGGKVGALVPGFVSSLAFSKA